MTRNKLVWAGLLACTTTSVQANAAVILNQLPASVTGSPSAYDSQIFSPPYTAYDSEVIDDFAVGSATQLTSVDVALAGIGPFTSFSNITAYTVQLYSSTTAAVASQTGDVASVTLPVTGVTFTTPYGAANTALVDIPVSINVLAGTYYVSVTPSLDFNAGGEIGVIVTGTGDAYQVNPGGGFGLPGNINASSGNAGYEGTAL